MPFRLCRYPHAWALRLSRAVQGPKQAWRRWIYPSHDPDAHSIRVCDVRFPKKLSQPAKYNVLPELCPVSDVCSSMRSPCSRAFLHHRQCMLVETHAQRIPERILKIYGKHQMVMTCAASIAMRCSRGILHCLRCRIRLKVGSS